MPFRWKDRRMPAKNVKQQTTLREPIVEGIFYPAEKTELANYLERALAPFEKSRGKAFAIVSPHAAYDYSGAYSAEAFSAAADRKIKTVAIIAPVHREQQDGLFLTESDYFVTPLGKMRVAANLISTMESCGTKIYRNDIPHLEEHAIEVQIPFIQLLYPKAAILPILIGKMTESNITILARALDTTLADAYESTLIVVSSNLTGYSEKTTSDSTELLFDLIEKGAGKELIARLEKKEISACGAGGIAALFLMNMPSLSAKVLSSTAGSNQKDDEGNTVHYGAIAFYR